MNQKPDLSKVRVKVKWYEDMWQEIKDATMTTIGKDTGKYPDSQWKRRLVMSEHSPIRVGRFIVKIYDCPQFVIGHLVRHFNGFHPFCATLRSDRHQSDEVPNRNTLTSATFDIGFQAAINISRKRKCTQASKETQFVWNLICEEFGKLEPELFKGCVRECVYRNGLCPEMFPCGYNHTAAFKKELDEYLDGFEEQVSRYYRTDFKPLFLIVGKSGTGKTTIVNRLVSEYGCKTIDSYTTRPPRYADEKGHVFVTNEEFAALNDLVAYTFYNGYHYGATAQQVDEADVYVIDPAGVKELAKLYHTNRPVIILYLMSEDDTRRSRMRQRGDSEEQIEQRINADNQYDWYNKLCQTPYHGYILRADEVTEDELLETVLHYIQKTSRTYTEG